MNTDIIITRAANKRGCYLTYCNLRLLNSLNLHAWLHVNAPSEGFIIHCMKTRSSHHSENKLCSFFMKLTIRCYNCIESSNQSIYTASYIAGQPIGDCSIRVYRSLYCIKYYRAGYFHYAVIMINTLMSFK